MLVMITDMDMVILTIIMVILMNIITNTTIIMIITTIMTTMRNLEKKGALQHTLKQRTYVYTAALKKPEAIRRVLKDVVSVFFGSSYKELANALVDGEIMADEEVASILETINRMKHEKREDTEKDGGTDHE